MPRPYRYHVWHRPVYDTLPPWSHFPITVPPISGTGARSKRVYSLKKDMDQLRADGAAKGIVDSSVVDVGKSWEGRELWALKVGNNPSHKVLFTGCHHAREWISVEIAYLVAEYLIQKFTATPTTPNEKRVKHLLMNRQIWFVPMVNPDGHLYTMLSNRNWRPNRKPHVVPSHTYNRYWTATGEISTALLPGGHTEVVSVPAGTYIGVDLNRNYATSTWGQETAEPAIPRGYIVTSANPADSGENSLWCGPSASSEKETKTIDDLFRKEKFRASISYHSYSQLLLYPDAAGGDAFLQDVGKGMRDLIAEKGNPYTYESGSGLYRTTGDLMEFSYEVSPGRPTYTVELRPPLTGPFAHRFSGLPESEIESCFRENLPAALALINCAGHDSAPTSKIVCHAKWTWPPMTCTVVRNCWEVFKGWTL